MTQDGCPISILILTLDEEVNLPGCLKSIEWCDDIVILDSHSKDRTLQIARDFGCRIYQRRFDNYAAQRNYGLKKIEYAHDWVFMLDADERFSPELTQEIYRVVPAAPETIDLYRIRRKDYFMGRWIKHAMAYPIWFGRLVRPERVWVERKINEEYHCKGQVGYLQEHIIHYPFNKGLKHWFDRHNRYSSMEAELVAKQGVGVEWRGLFSSDPTVRRKNLKNLSFALPLRPAMVFFYLTLIKKGILDGVPGITYAFLRSFYEAMIDLKVKEIRLREKGKPL